MTKLGHPAHVVIVSIHIYTSLNHVPNAQVCVISTMFGSCFSFFFNKNFYLFLFLIFLMCFLFLLLLCIIKIKCFFFHFCIFCLFGCKFEVWRKKTTPHSFSSRVFLHYYKFYFFLIFYSLFGFFFFVNFFF
jgi:hypothetical protein